MNEAQMVVVPDDITNSLLEYYSEAEVLVWLNSSNLMLEGRTAIEVIASGRADRVRHLIRSLNYYIYT